MTHPDLPVVPRRMSDSLSLMPSNTWSPAELAVALEALLLRNPPQVSEPGDCTVLDVRADGEGALVTFRFMADAHVLGYHLGPGSAYTEDGTALSVEDWAVHAQIWLEEQLGTGLVGCGARRQRDGFVELTEPGYPVDRRFFSDSVGPADDYRWAAIELFQHDGFDTAAVESLRAAGTLISWERAYLDNRAGAPGVGHAAIVRTGAEAAHLAFCEVADGVPDTVMLWLC